MAAFYCARCWGGWGGGKSSEPFGEQSQSGPWALTVMFVQRLPNMVEMTAKVASNKHHLGLM